MNTFNVDHLNIVYILLLVSVLSQVESVPVQYNVSNSDNATDNIPDGLSTEEPAYTIEITTPSPQADIESTKVSDIIELTTEKHVTTPVPISVTQAPTIKPTMVSNSATTTTQNEATNRTSSTQPGNNPPTEDSTVTIQIAALFAVTLVVILILFCICIVRNYKKYCAKEN